MEMKKKIGLGLVCSQYIVLCIGAASLGVSEGSSGFVKRDGPQLQLDGKQFYFTGANFYSAMVNAAGGGQTRNQTTAIFEVKEYKKGQEYEIFDTVSQTDVDLRAELALQMMQSLGMTVLRTWAFNDYGINNTWQALQTSPKVFSEQVFSQGLDWIISEAPKYGVKLLLTLTNYQQGYGGAYQYVKWAKGSSILDFYTNPIIVDWYQNNVKTIVGRRNSITGIPYKDDPGIFGWELINEPHVPGDDTGKVLTSWVDMQSKYLKDLDSNHLVGVGVEGFFGRSTPSRLADNPLPDLESNANAGYPAPFTCICEGQDFTANHAPQGIDFTSIHIYPDHWATGNLAFQLQFTAQFISSHMAESAVLNKPLIISEFGRYPPLADRNAYLKYVYKFAADSAATNGPLAGTMIWTLATMPEFPYNFGFTPFSVYPTPDPYTQPAPAWYLPPTERAATNAALLEFYGKHSRLPDDNIPAYACWSEQIACNDRYINNPKGLASNQPLASDGWDDTLAIIRQNVADMAKGSAGTSSSTSSSLSKHTPLGREGRHRNAKGGKYVLHSQKPFGG